MQKSLSQKKIFFKNISWLFIFGLTAVKTSSLWITYHFNSECFRLTFTYLLNTCLQYFVNLFCQVTQLRNELEWAGAKLFNQSNEGLCVLAYGGPFAPLTEREMASPPPPTPPPPPTRQSWPHSQAGWTWALQLAVWFCVTFLKIKNNF